MAAVVLGASAFLGACATQAIGEEITINSNDEDGHVVRMVIDRIDEEGDETTRLCVFVPAGDEAVGAMSCSGDDVRVFEFGGGHGRQVVIDGDVVDEEEIRALIELRLAAVNDRLAEVGDLHIEYIEQFNSEEFQQEMAVLQSEMEELHREMRFEFSDVHEMSPEERAAFEEEMAEFAAEMREFEGEMAELQAEVMVELAEEMTELREEGIHIRSSGPGAPGHNMRWFGDSDHMSRNVIRINRDGDDHVTIIERSEDDDGNPKLVIRTTDPSSVEVIQLDPDELDELDD